MQESAAFSGPVARVPVCVLLYSDATAQLTVAKESLMPGFVNPLCFSAVADVLETLEFVISFITSLQLLWASLYFHLLLDSRE